MSIPSFQDLTLPTLKLAGDGKEHTVAEAAEHVANALRLSDADLAEMLPSRRQSRFRNRIAWAITYLKAAVLISSTGRGRFIITPRGRDLLGKVPERLDLTFLMQFPEIREFRGAGRSKTDKESLEEVVTTSETPLEIIEGMTEQLRKKLSVELIEKVKACSPEFFEKLVVRLLVKMGYGGTFDDAAQVVGKSGDGGIDGIIKEDRLGLDMIYVQAKRWENTVGRPVVSEFAGSLQSQRARKGVFITTSSFSADAREFVSRIDSKIILIDGSRLADLMMDHGVGVSIDETFVVHKIDNDAFEDPD